MNTSTKLVGRDPSRPFGAPEPQEQSNSEPASSERGQRTAFDSLALEGRFGKDDVELLFEPVHDLLRGRATTFFCTPAFSVDGAPLITGYRAFQHLPADALPFVDRSILAHALKFTRRLQQAGVYASTSAPVSFETLISSEGRRLYQQALRAAGAEGTPALVLNISNLPIGITASRIAELVGYLRPFSKRVFVQLPIADTALSNCGQLGAGGFVLTMPRATRLEPERVTNWFAKFCDTQLALSCIDQIGSDTDLEAVKRSSIRFGMGKVFGAAWFKGDAAPVEIESFMRAAQRAARSENRNLYRAGAGEDLRIGQEAE